MGGASGEVGAILTDWASYYRYVNLLKIRDKVAAKHKERGINGTLAPLPPRLAIPIIENASLEGEEILQDVWARLIANATDPGSDTGIHPSFVHLISEFSSDEARILEAASNLEEFPMIVSITLSSNFGGNKVNEPLFVMVGAEFKEFCDKLDLQKPAHALFYLDNLLRLQLLDKLYEPLTELDGPSNFALPKSDDPAANEILLKQSRTEYVRVTRLGEGFITACIRGDRV